MSPATAHHLGRNDPCHCGSGKKYKHCCLEKDQAAARAAAEQAASAEAEAVEGTAAPSPRPPRPPKHQTQQPWRKSAANTHGFQRMSTPRKVGGS
ncbi:MAG: SEC-C metal-binding domain-containing protein [Vicinamibacterales bacterium]